MAVLFVAKFKLGIYEGLTHEQKVMARGMARRVFGYDDMIPGEAEVQTSATRPPEPATDTGMLHVPPTTGVKFMYVDSFRHTHAGDKDFGWIAIVTDDTYHQMMDMTTGLGWPNSPFWQMFAIDIIPLNDDTRTQDVYRYMTPSHWY